MSRTSKAGSALCAISWLALALCCAASAFGRDLAHVADWLCGNVFAGDGATLALTRDGFFGLRLDPAGAPPQYVTGQWRIEPDGVNILLFNRQDAEIQITAGKDALYGTLGGKTQAILRPVANAQASFRATGLFERANGRETLTDAGSGRVFPANAPKAEHGKFATFELIIDGAGARLGKAIRHSGAVPRFFAPAAKLGGVEGFLDNIAGRFWILPSLPGVSKAALRFSPPQENAGALRGEFEIAGPGLRYEGQYHLDEDKLTFSPDNISLNNIKLMGAGILGEIFQGTLTWLAGPGGLELSGRRHLLLTPADSMLAPQGAAERK